MKPFIILVAGRIGAGKDTMADHLVEKYGFAKMALADGVKESAAQTFGFPVIWGYTRAGKLMCPSLGGGLTVGEILQKYGTEVGRNINPNIWCDKLAARIEGMGCPKVVVSDCRFLNEHLYFAEEYDALTVGLTRRSKTLEQGRDTQHASERGVDRIFEEADRQNFNKINNQDTSVSDTRIIFEEVVCQYFKEWLDFYEYPEQTLAEYGQQG